MTRHFLRDDDLSPAEQQEVLSLAATLKPAPFDSKQPGGPAHGRDDLRQADTAHPGVVRGRHRRARRLPDDGRRSLAGIGERESVADVARVLGRQAAAIVWRTFAQGALEEMADHAGVPVVNALTDQFHPCQILADLQTIREHKGPLAGLTVAFVGAVDGPLTGSRSSSWGDPPVAAPDRAGPGRHTAPSGWWPSGAAIRRCMPAVAPASSQELPMFRRRRRRTRRSARRARPCARGS